MEGIIENVNWPEMYPEKASEEIMSKIICRTSIEKHSVFEPTHYDEWTLDIEVPSDAFWHSWIKNFDGIKAKANLYKCVECPERMHFLSWAPIDTPKPDFHSPEFFQPIKL